MACSAVSKLSINYVNVWSFSCDMFDAYSEPFSDFIRPFVIPRVGRRSVASWEFRSAMLAFFFTGLSEMACWEPPFLFRLLNVSEDCLRESFAFFLLALLRCQEVDSGRALARLFIRVSSC